MKKFEKQPINKPCKFCQDHTEYIDYKDVKLLKKYSTDKGKIKARRLSGNCAQHQKEIANAIKRARIMALIPYSIKSVSKRLGRRR
jgi:small subunit ribosomal protein S18